MTEPTKKTFTAPPGGVMTDEAGAITGEVEAWLEGGSCKIAYVGALDTYTVTGKPDDGAGIDEIVAALAADPGPDETGNPGSTSLTG